MKRLLAFGLFGLGTAVLFGCPIYPSDRDHRVCLAGECYECPDSFYSDACNDWRCDTSNDCPSGYTCNSDHRCKLTSGTPTTPPADGTCGKPADCAPGTSCGADNKCHAGACDELGCPSGFVCALQSGSNGTPECIPIDAQTDGGSSTSSCKNDRDCPSPAGSRCLTGKCVAPGDQCVDATQCAADAQCVQGACTPKCSAVKACPTGYACDVAKGVCTGENPNPCSSSAQCTSGKGTVCVQEHCVEPCGAGGTCAAGLKCVDGGCTPDQQPVFTCATDGQQGECQQGSICLRHSCYIACDADAGAAACKNADTFNTCKSVTTSSGTYSVCGSTNNLGSECNPTKACGPALVCIDGYCR
ncbi:MAG: hypothetical protein KIT84_22660 [Labilithrix sp.]|nr:hypothetical protein [Labilithrix sp.]MCW5813847.1 hypothetical protein [Labilithrix sp.]